MRKLLSVVAMLLAFVCAPAAASVDSYIAELFGSNEVGGGDVDGFGVATVLINNVTNEVSWSILVLNVDLPIAAAHIHNGPAGANGPVKIDFSGQLTGSVVDDDAALITPTTALDFYVNVHNSVYPGGAIRGQLEYLRTTTIVPEPPAIVLLLAGLGLLGVLARRRVRRN